jgi:hypothetical protein
MGGSLKSGTVIPKKHNTVRPGREWVFEGREDAARCALGDDGGLGFVGGARRTLKVKQDDLVDYGEQETKGSRIRVGVVTGRAAVNHWLVRPELGPRTTPHNVAFHW